MVCMPGGLLHCEALKNETTLSVGPFMIASECGILELWKVE